MKFGRTDKLIAEIKILRETIRIQDATILMQAKETDQLKECEHILERKINALVDINGMLREIISVKDGIVSGLKCLIALNAAIEERQRRLVALHQYANQLIPQCEVDDV